MNVPTKILCCLVIGMLVVLPACSKSKISSTWKPEQLERGPMQKTLVIGMCTDPSTRELFESVFTLELMKHNVDATAGYETFGELCPSVDAIKAKCVELGVDSVLVARAISEQEAPIYQPPPTFETTIVPMPFDGYLTKSSSMGIQTGKFKRRTFIRLQTRIFDISTKKQIWSAKTNTMDPKSTYDLIHDLCDEIMTALKKDGLLTR